MSSSREEDSNRLLVPSRFSTEDLSGANSFDAWREYTRPMLDVEPHLDGVSFGTHSMATWSVGDLIFCQDTSPGLIYSRSPRRIRTTANDHYYLYFLKQGAYWGETDRGPRAGHSSEGMIGRVGLYTLTQPCHGELRNMNGFSVFLPRDSLGGLSGVLDAASNDIVGGSMGALLSEYIQQVERRLPELTRGESEGISRSILELVGACYANSRDAQESASDVINTAKKLKVRRFIQTQFANPNLSVDFIAQNVGMSRSSLYRLFENDGGIARYIEKVRLQKVLSALKDPSDARSVGQVAGDCGFENSRDLSRVFKRQFGCSAREIWRTSRAETSPEPATPPQRAIEIALQKSRGA